MNKFERPGITLEEATQYWKNSHEAHLDALRRWRNFEEQYENLRNLITQCIDIQDQCLTSNPILLQAIHDALDVNVQDLIDKEK